MFFIQASRYLQSRPFCSVTLHSAWWLPDGVMLFESNQWSFQSTRGLQLSPFCSVAVQSAEWLVDDVMVTCLSCQGCLCHLRQGCLCLYHCRKQEVLWLSPFCSVAFHLPPFHVFCSMIGRCYVIWECSVMLLVLTGNKGAVAITFLFSGTSLCFINAHLTSGEERMERSELSVHSPSHPEQFKGH